VVVSLVGGVADDPGFLQEVLGHVGAGDDAAVELDLDVLAEPGANNMMVIFGDLRQLSAIYANFRRFMPTFGDLRQFSAIYVNFRRFTPIFGDLRQLSAIYANFRRFTPMFSERIGVFLENQCYEQFVVYLAVFWVKCINLSPNYFGENIYIVVTLAPGRVVVPKGLGVAEALQKWGCLQNLFSDLSRNKKTRTRDQGCQIFLDTIYLNGGNITNCH
jgi:hypothetical protein